MPRILGRQGWWIDTAAGVDEALAFFAKRPTDVALINRDIGDGSGLTLLRAIKGHPAWRPIPVIMMYEEKTPFL